MKRTLPLILLALILALPAMAQPNNTLYYMYGVPQANRVNPSLVPSCNFYFGIPALSPVRVTVGTNSLAWKDLVYPAPGGNGLITAFHPQGDQDAFMRQLKDVNLLSTYAGSTIFSMGFRTGAGYFSIDVSTRIEAQVSYPGDLFRLVLGGALEDETYIMDGTGMSTLAFNEAGIGWAKEIGDRWRIGARAKMLFGFGNLSTTNSELSLYTSSEQWRIASDMQLKASLPFATVVYDDDGMIEDVIIDPELEKGDLDAIRKYYFNFQNLGFGLDIGASFQITDRINLSASLLDIGYIHWKEETHELTYKLEYGFEGLELMPAEFLGEGQGFDDYLDSLAVSLEDTILSAIEMQATGPYTTRLNSKLYLGASFQAAEKVRFGLLSRTDFFQQAVIEQLTASAHFTTGRFLSFSLSYSYMNGYFKNLGFGISLNILGLNAFVVTDNGLSSVFWPHETTNVGVWAGLNLKFGCNKKVKYDYPLVQ